MDKLEAQKTVNTTLGKYRLEIAKRNIKAYVFSSASAIVIGAATGGLAVKLITKSNEQAIKATAVAAGYLEFIYLMYKHFTTDASSFSCNYQRLKEIKGSLKRELYNPLEDVTLEEFTAKYELPGRQKKLGTYPIKKDA